MWWVPLSILPASALSVEAVRALVSRRGRLEEPRAERWSARATPTLGGLGFVPCFLLGSLLLSQQRVSLVTVGCTLPMLVLGALDDAKPLSARAKLSIQMLVAAAAVVAGAVLPLTGLLLADQLLTVLFVVAATNALNLSDNMDGLAAGLALITSLALALIFYLGGAGDGAWVAMALAAAIFGFWLHNKPPARIFMGDAGSLATGMALAVLTVQAVGSEAGSAEAAGIPLLLFAVPFADVALVFTTRWWAGRSVLEGGTDHASHRLARLGLTTGRVLMVGYSVAAAGALAAVMIGQ